MSERSTPDGHDAEGNYDWRNDPLENTPIVRGYQPTKWRDIVVPTLIAAVTSSAVSIFVAWVMS